MNVEEVLFDTYWKLKQAFFIGLSENSLILRLVYSQYHGLGVSGEGTEEKVEGSESD
jgi:hypothetical protein